MLEIWTPVLFMTAAVAAFRSKSMLNPATLLLTEWIAVLWINRIPYLSLHEPSQSTYSLIALSLIGFTLGYIAIPNQARFVKIQRKSLLLAACANTKVQRLHTIFLTGLIFVLLLFARNVRGLLESFSAAELRDAVVRDQLAFAGVIGGLSGSQVAILWAYVIYPVTYGLFAISICRCLVTNTTASGLLLIGSLFSILLLDFIAVARNQTLLAILTMALVFSVGVLQGVPIWRAQSRVKVFYITSAFLGVVGVVYLAVMSFARHSMGSDTLSGDFLRATGVYLAGPISAFELRDHVLVDRDPWIYSVGGICDISTVVVQALTGARLPLHRSMDLQKAVNLGNYTHFNALYTWCIYFFQDFGVFGVVGVPALFGVFLGLLHQRYRATGDLGVLLSYVFFVTIALYSIWEWRLAWDQWTMVSFVMLILAVPLGENAKGAYPWSLKKREDSGVENPSSSALWSCSRRESCRTSGTV